MRITSYFKPEEDIILLNTQYVPPVYNENKLQQKGVLYLTYRDNKTKEKKVKTIIDPKSQTFITKPEYRSSFKTQRTFLYDYMVDGYDVPYSSIPYFIQKVIKEDGTDIEYLEICQKASKEAFKWRHSYFADYNICDYAMIAYLLDRDTEDSNFTIPTVSKAFLDIESDIYGLSSSEIDDVISPINAVSVVVPFDEYGVEFKHPKVFTFLLRNHVRYKDQAYFEDHLDKFLSECHDEFDSKYNKPQFIIRIYDDEITMLKMLFAMLHKMRPDFIEIWNMSYDVPTIIKRLIKLGENPTNYFCHPDMEFPYFRYNYDNIYKNDIKNKCESFDCTSYSRWIDQMTNYAGINKSRSDYGGNSLDNIAKIELNAEKRRYDGKTVSVINGAIEEYWNFVKYSINDVLLQYGIDNRTENTQALFEQSLYGGTRYDKTLKQSVYLKNVFAIDFFKHNIVPKNNNNVNYSRYGNDETAVDIDNVIQQSDADYDEMSLPGALVGNPLNNGHCGVEILGEKSNALFANVMDEDYSALYPNIKQVSNIAENTQLGRVIVPEQILPDENPDNNPKFIRGGKLIEDIETGDESVCGKWIGLKDMTDYIKRYSSWRLEND